MKPEPMPAVEPGLTIRVISALVGGNLDETSVGVAMLVPAWRAIPTADRNHEAARALAIELCKEAPRLVERAHRLVFDTAGPVFAHERAWAYEAGQFGDNPQGIMALDAALVARLRDLESPKADEVESGAKRRWEQRADGSCLEPWCVLCQKPGARGAWVGSVDDTGNVTPRVPSWGETVRAAEAAGLLSARDAGDVTDEVGEADYHGERLYNPALAGRKAHAIVDEINAATLAAASGGTFEDWAANRWQSLARALWPSVKAELERRRRVGVTLRTFPSAVAALVAGREGLLSGENADRGGLLWMPPTVPAIQAAVLTELRERAPDVARSIHSNKLLRNLATHARRTQNERVMIQGGWAAVAAWLGFRNNEDARRIEDAAMFWDAMRLVLPEDDLNVRVLTAEEGPDASDARRHLVKLTAGEALTWARIAAPRDFAAVRPIPVPEHLPPPALDRAQRGAEAWLQWELVALLTERAPEYQAKGWVQLSHADWAELLDAVGLPASTRRTPDVAGKVREGWQGRGPQSDLFPYIEVDCDRVKLASAHKAIEAFIVQGGEHRAGRSESARRGWAKRRAGESAAPRKAKRNR